MASGIKAIYDDEAGVFKPTEPVDLKDTRGHVRRGSSIEAETLRALSLRPLP